MEDSLELGHVYDLSQKSPADHVLQKRKTYIVRIRQRMQSFAKIYACLIASFKGPSESTKEPLYFCHKELAYSLKDALIARIYEKTNDITDGKCDRAGSWGEVLEHLQTSRRLLIKNRDYKSVSAELYKNEAICYIILDGNILHNRKSPPVEVGRITRLLQNAKDEAPDEESNDIYPIGEWRRRNNC